MKWHGSIFDKSSPRFLFRNRRGYNKTETNETNETTIAKGPRRSVLQINTRLLVLISCSFKLFRALSISISSFFMSSWWGIALLGSQCAFFNLQNYRELDVLFIVIVWLGSSAQRFIEPCKIRSSFGADQLVDHTALRFFALGFVSAFKFRDQYKQPAHIVVTKSGNARVAQSFNSF